MGWKQGWYHLKHPEKYVGQISRVRYMSSWEHKTHQFFDNNPNVLKWGSEEIAIPYIKPTDHKVHNYYPDYWIYYRNKKGKLVQEIVEIKPYHQLHPTRKRKSKERLREQIIYAINTAKWTAAQQFCDKYGMKFRLLTENGIFK
jgi:hypothetical protein